MSQALVGEWVGEGPSLCQIQICQARRAREISTQGGETGWVDAVVVASDEALWGTFDPDTSTVHAHGHPVGADEDLLNIAAVKALQTGGRAYALPIERLPRRSPAVATMRY